jgi:NADH:ubiquinone oxidoreductase subunit 4 (subunit M)
VPLAGGLALAALGLALLWLGLYPTPLLDLIETAIAGLI